MTETHRLLYTPTQEIPQIHARLQGSFKSKKLLPVSYRKEQILQLAYLLQDNKDRFLEAFKHDLGRGTQDTLVFEITSSINDCIDAYNNVEKWAKPEGVAFSMQYAPMRPRKYKQPKGVALIIGPFNYPIWCTLPILAGAIAAGCPGIVKMSEQTPAISSLVAELFPKYLDSECFACVNGSVPETTALLALKWGHIVFTGSGTVGKIVAAAAAKHLTPVTLELGGQSPTIVDPRTDLKFAARRILWGKTVNVGQTCTAPNHIYIPKEGQDAFVQALKEVYASFYPEGPGSSNSVSRIVSESAFNRLKGMIERTRGRVVLGGETDASQKFIAPTVVADVDIDDSLMESEIFGPILPIVPVEDFDEAIKLINEKDHPLALYLFTDDPALKTKVIENTTSGAVAINETVIHVGVPGLPFGGVGGSGYGAHTGKYTFDTFTHIRSSIDSPQWVDKFFGWRFPPYTTKTLKQSKQMAMKIPAPRPGTTTPSSWGMWKVVTAAGALIAGVLWGRKAISI